MIALFPTRILKLVSGLPYLVVSAGCMVYTTQMYGNKAPLETPRENAAAAETAASARPGRRHFKFPQSSK